MNANSFCKGVGLLIALCIFSAIFASLYQPATELMPEHRFLSDSSYVGVSAADSYAGANVYGLSVTEGIPATRNALWHSIQIGLSFLSVDIFQATIVLNFILVIFTIVCLWRTVKLMENNGGLVLGALTVAACSGPLFSWAIGGDSRALAAFIAAWALMVHTRSLVNYTPLLPLKLAWLIGLGVMLHVEMLALWIAFALHAVWVSIIDKRTSSFTYSLTQLFSGVLVIALCLWPLVNWNMLLLNVPWPATMGAAFSLDSLVAGQLPVAQSLGSYVQEGLGLLVGDRGLHGPLLIMYGIAFIAVMARSTRSGEDRLLLPLYLMPVIITAVAAVISSLLGREGLLVLSDILQPFMLVLVVYGLFRIPSLLSPLLSKFEGNPIIPIITRTLGVGLILVLSLFAQQNAQSHLEEEMNVLQEKAVERITIKNVLNDSLDGSQPMLTDIPGWVSYFWDGPIIDVNGIYTPQFVSCRDPSGAMNANRLTAFIKARTPGYLYLNKADALKISAIIEDRAGEEYSVKDITPDNLQGLLLALTWTAAP